MEGPAEWAAAVARSRLQCGGHGRPCAKDGAALSQASTAPSTPGKLLLPDPYHELPADGMLPFGRMLSSASTQEPLLEECHAFDSPCATPALEAREPGPEAAALGEVALESELGRWAQTEVQAEEDSTQPGSERERSCESSVCEESAWLGIPKCLPLQSELGHWVQAMVEVAPGAGGAGAGTAGRPRKPRRRCHRRRRRHSDGGPQAKVPQLRPLRSKLGRFAQAICEGGPVLCSELGIWAEAVVRAQESMEGPAVIPRLRPLRSALGRFAEDLCTGGPVLRSALGIWAEAAVREEEWQEAQPPPCKPCPVDAQGVAHGANAVQLPSVTEGSLRAARLKLLHQKRRARRAPEPEPSSRWALDDEGRLRQVLPAARGFKFGAALRLKLRLLERRAREAAVGWSEDLLFVDAEGTVQGFRPL